MNVINHGNRRRRALTHLLETRSQRLVKKALPFPRARRPSRDIVDDELAALIRSQVLSSIHDIYGDTPSRGGAFDERQDNTKSIFDQRRLEASIDQLVASSLVNGRQTSGVLRLLFGLVPSLIGR